ncbi:MAG: phosphoribosylformylglycinamidine synthase [Phycisphaerales bacterium]|nr:phosphoribosylformylglycinamidine synthase [Phycisphaerales bacterium]
MSDTRSTNPSDSADRVARIEVALRPDAPDQTLLRRIQEAGLTAVREARARRVYLLEGDLTPEAVQQIAGRELSDPVAESVHVAWSTGEVRTLPRSASVEVHPRPGVMDPVALSALAELQAAGFPVRSVRTARRYLAIGESIDDDALARCVSQALANAGVDEVIPGSAGVTPAPRPKSAENALRRVPIRGQSDESLLELSRRGHLFLNLAEMQAIRAHFDALQRDPTDLEMETIAQTWSEHCVHKTLKSAVRYRGSAFPDADGRTDSGEVEVRFGNLLKDTIAAATHALIAERRGPECLSVFVDNAGVIGLDESHGIAFKVETHNRPSAIEPYGGAATGIGGCIRDVMGCGLGARPIANTDVFCVAPGDWPAAVLPRGVLHPDRVLRGVVRGVADYGNRMGIPTVNGAVQFDPRYLGNPLVFCGCVGLIPRNRVEKRVAAGDSIVVAGGRTGRDGIHGATFSSAEITDTHAGEFSSAVQVGNAITQKRLLDALLAARDATGGCLYSAVTDCGAGGLSSAVGEMGATVGADVELDGVLLKYAGLRYDEIWISEAQERMVLAVPPERLAALERIFQAEQVEFSVIGRFGLTDEHGAARLRVRHADVVVGDLAMDFLHDGLPKREATAAWRAGAAKPIDQAARRDWPTRLLQALSCTNTKSREWIIRSYDHEVQGASVIKPLMGPGAGPCDAAVLRPIPGSQRGIAIGCGLAPHLSDVDPYWMACAAIDEAIRNVVCVGGDPAQLALLDNFSWGRCDDEEVYGALVRACRACHDSALIHGAPFISGKDSLSNEFALHAADVPALLDELRRRGVTEAILERIRRTGRLMIPHTLLISAVAVVPDVRRCLSSDLKQPGAALLAVGGLPETGYSRRTADRVHRFVAAQIADGHIRACHDMSGGGVLTAVAEMAIGGRRGVQLAEELAASAAAWGRVVAGYVVEAPDPALLMQRAADASVAIRSLGVVREDDRFVADGAELRVGDLAAAWRGRDV